MESLLIQILNGLARASTLFLMASGLIANFWRKPDRQFRAWIVLCMLGLYAACTTASFWNNLFPRMKA
jgi:branched-subunit amino acid ABC-type transport system permease component